MTGPRTLVRTPVVRRPTGHDLDLIGDETEHITSGTRCCTATPTRVAVDGEEIAMATLLERMADRVPGSGPEPTRWPKGCSTGRSR